MSTADPTMKKKKTKTDPAKTVDNEDVILRLPYDIIVDIFCKVPTKKLLQFNTVCKSWHSLLSDPQFARDLYSQTPSCFIMHSEVQTGQIDIFIVDPEKASSRDGVSMRVPMPANADTSLSCNIVGICNGLLCIRDTRCPNNSYAFELLQPITGETLALPRLKKLEKGEKLRGYGFGFSPITRVYKLLVILQPDKDCYDEFKAMVLTVGSKSWRNIGSCYIYCRGRCPKQDLIYLNGSLHWYYYKSSRLIYAFDIESERFQEFQMDSVLKTSWEIHYSFCHNHFVNKLGVLGGYLSFTDHKKDDPNNHDVWVMKKYGGEESWTKELTITYQEKEELAIQNFHPIQPLKFTDGKLILTSYTSPVGSCSLIAYSTLQKSEIERIEVVGMPKDTTCIQLFVPSLVSLKDILWVS